MTDEHIPDKILEEELKAFILNNGYLFGDLGECRVMFEKTLPYSYKHDVKKTIADALIFTHDKGLIGIEIKSKSDSTYRLRRQLRGYTLTCNTVYVMCHDSHAEKVEAILNEDKLTYSHVGIISFAEYKGIIVPGMYREPHYNHGFSAYHAVNMLHKNEISSIMSGFRESARAVAEAKGLKALEVKSRSDGIHGILVASDNPYTMKKPHLVRNFIKRVGEEEAVNLMCRLFINHKYNPSRLIKLYHFKDRE